MSAIETNRSLAGEGVHGVVANVLALLSKWNDGRMTRRALDRLSDRELDDIGLSRADIVRVARGR